MESLLVMKVNHYEAKKNHQAGKRRWTAYYFIK
nr:MAG TPA: hypothetical protein [Caudoviricetes sp.]